MVTTNSGNARLMAALSENTGAVNSGTASWNVTDPQAISPRSAGDEDKLGSALGRVAAEDPTLRIEHPE